MAVQEEVDYDFAVWVDYDGKHLGEQCLFSGYRPDFGTVSCGGGGGVTWIELLAHGIRVGTTTLGAVE